MRKICLFIFAFMLFRAVTVMGQTTIPDTNAVVFINVNVWDGTRDSLLRNAQVVIIGNHIHQVGSGVTLPSGAKIIDGKGGTLMPGLSDVHVRLMYNMPVDKLYDSPMPYVAARAVMSAGNFLQGGFTTVRDMGGPVFGIKEAIDEGICPGPRIYPAGAVISQTSGYRDMHNFSDYAPPFELLGWSYLADGSPEVLNAVRENLRHGASQIKMGTGGNVYTGNDPLNMVQFTEDELKVAVQAASDWGSYVGVYACHPEGIMRALNAGAKTIEYGHMVNDTAMIMIRDKGAYLIPQCYCVFRDPSGTADPEKFKQAQAGTAQEMELAKKYGVKVGFASDVSGNPGGEKEALSEFTARTKWYTPLEVLRQATSGNAEILALSGRLNPYPDRALGVIKEGAYADLLIYDGNPLEDIQVVVDYPKHLKLIMKNGKIYKNEL